MALFPDKLRPRLGKTFIDQLTGDVVLSVGTSRFSKDDLVRIVKCGNFSAARRLGHALDQLGITTAAQLAKLQPLDLARLKGIGETTVYVLLCVQDALDQSPLDWERTWSTYARTARNRKRKRKQ